MQYLHRATANEIDHTLILVEDQSGSTMLSAWIKCNNCIRSARWRMMQSTHGNRWKSSDHFQTFATKNKYFLLCGKFLILSKITI